MKLKYHFFNLFISFFLVFKYKENNNLKIVNQNKFKILGEEKWDVIKNFVTRIKKEKEFKKEKENFEIEKGKLNDKIRELENEIDVLRGRLDKFEEKREMIKEQMKRTLLNYVENNKI